MNDILNVAFKLKVYKEKIVLNHEDVMWSLGFVFDLELSKYLGNRLINNVNKYLLNSLANTQ